MGRNFYSVCNACGVYLMHFRGKEGDFMHKFADDHYKHKQYTEVIDDYVEEPDEGYTDVFDMYHDEPAPTKRGIKEKIMSKLTDESVYCEYDRDLNHKFMACEKCQHNMKIEATKTQPTNSIDSELENILTSLPQYNLGDDPITEQPFTAEETLSVYPELRKALQAIKSLYISRKEIEEAIKDIEENKLIDNPDDSYQERLIKTHHNIGRSQSINTLRAKLLPPTKGGKDE